jgi:lipoprotein NlpI
MRLMLYVLLLQVAVSFAGDPEIRTPAIREMLARYERQLESAERDVKAHPNAVAAYSQAGDLYLFLGKFKESVTAYEKMIALDPTQDAPHWRLGIAYYFTGDYAKSAKQFEKYHAYDGRDRENGVWKCMAQIRAEGLEKARQEMLVYTRFDREPFPSLYEMFAGKKSAQAVLDEMAEKKLTDNAQVMFFAHYYAGIYQDLLGVTPDARTHLRTAVGYYTPETASAGGPGFMWQVARLQMELLEKK